MNAVVDFLDARYAVIEVWQGRGRGPWTTEAALPCDILSAFLVFCNRLVYPSYLSTSQVFGMAPLQDQECAGALMWVWVTFAYVIPAVAITVQILSRPNIESQGMRDARRRPAVRPLNGAEVR